MRRRHRVKPRFWVFLMVLTISVSIGGRAVINEDLARKAEHLETLKARYVYLSDEIDELESSIDFARTDAYVEQMARVQLGWLMPGDIRYVRQVGH